MERYLCLIVLCPMICLAQVGINTIAPLQGVHVAGATSTVKIEGLNSPNNVKNFGGANSSRVFVNANGDLVLGDVANNIEVIFDAENYLSDAQDTGGADANDCLQTGTGSGYTVVGWPRVIGPGSSTFTLTRPAIVEINYSLSWGNIEKAGIRLSDGHARIVQCFMYLKSGGPAGADVINDLDGQPIGLIGPNGQFYTNNSFTRGERNTFHNTGTDYVKLPAGTYCPMFKAQLAVSDTGGTGAVKMFWGVGNDEVQIIAHYYQ
ncbi:hypothetical protein [Flavobacterium sp. GT3R68]|uniref:hypothetical protein n=1 Tax=Flavobacterium sp. GT3R68 TaxID=2594437 RepID=UPI000F862324|nr:hypothetical protein [Flavobacterium sp. GT3R68]RTY95969.1 hypothetical protein EKL32_04815 [Flavobacterium sp. GSN2]TRW93742.1 hypothetical protein FNW07_02205 [Flavobacterium sp. GT3R68]